MLTASDLNSEFNNLLNNPTQLISPLTANLDLDGFSLIDLARGTVSTPGLAFTGDTNTGLYWVGTDILGFAAGGVTVFTASAYANAVNFPVLVPSQTNTAVVYAASGSDTNVSILLRGKGTGYVQASRFVFESFVATQSSVQAGRAYWHTTEGALHIDAGTLIARVPALTGVQAGDLIAATNPTGVSGATAYARVPIGGATQYLGVSSGIPAYVDAYPKSRLNFGTPNNLSSNSVNYLQVWGNAGSEGVIERQYLPYAGRLKNIFVSAGTSPGAGQDYKITTRVNGASAFSTITIPTGQSDGSITTETYHVSQFQFVTVQVTLSSTATTTSFSVTMEYDGANLQ